MDRSPNKAEILGALSHALDLVEGQPEGHAERSARIALRLGQQLGLDDATLNNLYFAGLLKDSGCSNNAVRIAKMFGGDEHLSKKAVKLIDWTNALESVKFAFQFTEVGQSLGSKLRRMAANIGPPGKVMNEVTEARCTRGAAIAARLGFGLDVADAVLYLDEHWDGRGAPYGKRGDEIPLMAQILCLAQTFEVFMVAFGLTNAYDMLADRKGKWFSPELCDAMRALEGENAFWAGQEACDMTPFWHLLDETAALDADIDSICEAFAMIIDAKSSFTAEHSTRVTQYAVALSLHFGFDEGHIQTMRRAGLLHDIGKLGVPTTILEKPGRLDEAEFARVREHPKYSDSILRPIPTFAAIAELASSHHERLDGKGYWRGLGAEQLPLDARILTAADVFDALTARRPYRDAMPVSEALSIMRKDEGTAFDGACLAALSEIYEDKQLAAA